MLDEYIFASSKIKEQLQDQDSHSRDQYDVNFDEHLNQHSHKLIEELPNLFAKVLGVIKISNLLDNLGFNRYIFEVTRVQELIRCRDVLRL